MSPLREPERKRETLNLHVAVRLGSLLPTLCGHLSLGDTAEYRALMATSASSDWRGRHRESEPLDFLSLPLSSPAITNTSRFVWEMAEIIETEFGIKALQATLVERRNKDRLGHVFCNLRLIIVPGGIHKASSQPAGHPACLLGRKEPNLAEAAKEMRRGEGRICEEKACSILGQLGHLSCWLEDLIESLPCWVASPPKRHTPTHLHCTPYGLKMLAWAAGTLGGWGGWGYHRLQWISLWVQSLGRCTWHSQQLWCGAGAGHLCGR